MCGIVAYIGTDAQNTLFEMLKKLEYRGYDSAGIATICKTEFDVVKTVGNVENLKPKLDNMPSTIGIGHTRWATHGNPTQTNAHPHLSPNGNWAIVHNGIIENFAELKLWLTSKGYSFRSDTDTEVIAALFELFDTLPQNEQIQCVVSKLVGSFAFAALNKNDPDSMILVKKKSPLYASISSDKIYAASDPVAFGEVKNYYIFEENEYCIATQNSLEFHNFRGEKVHKRPVSHNFCQRKSEKNFSHHMLEEIYECPTALKTLCKAFEEKYHDKIKKIISYKFDKIYIVGCGTAYHSGLVGAKYLQNDLKICVSCHIASEFKYDPPIIDEHTLCIFVSQSGETADTISSLLEAKKRRAKNVAIVNSPHSTLSRLAHISFPIEAGVEVAVASTKAYANQCAAFYLLSKALTNQPKKFITATKNIKKLSNTISKLLSSSFIEDIKNVADQIKKAKNVFFIGKNYDYITACEASLKLKEISYINCCALPAGELKHGTLALVENGVFVIAISTQAKLAPKTQNSLIETRSRGASTLLFTSIENQATPLIKLPHTTRELSPILAITPLWLLSYFTSTKKGINPDRPRNLAKSVTVE